MPFDIIVLGPRYCFMLLLDVWWHGAIAWMTAELLVMKPQRAFLHGPHYWFMLLLDVWWHGAIAWMTAELLVMSASWVMRHCCWVIGNETPESIFMKIKCKYKRNTSWINQKIIFQIKVAIMLARPQWDNVLTHSVIYCSLVLSLET